MSWKKTKKRVDYSKDPGGYYIVPACIRHNKVLTSSSKEVLAYILSLWGCCKDTHPSIDRISEMTSRSESSVIRARNKLVQLGLISIVQGNGRGNTSMYEINPIKLNEFLGVELCNVEHIPVKGNDSEDVLGKALEIIKNRK